MVDVINHEGEDLAIFMIAINISAGVSSVKLFFSFTHSITERCSLFTDHQFTIVKFPDLLASVCESNTVVVIVNHSSGRLQIAAHFIICQYYMAIMPFRAHYH